MRKPTVYFSTNSPLVEGKPTLIEDVVGHPALGTCKSVITTKVTTIVDEDTFYTKNTRYVRTGSKYDQR